MKPEDAKTRKNAPYKKICGAKNRQGLPCGKPPMIGKNRCKLHGGAQKKGAERPQHKHGIYTESYSPEEMALLDALNERLGTVDDEINMTRIRLRRAQLAEQKFLAEAGSLELVEIRQTTGGEEPTTTTVEKIPDFHGIIDRLAGRLGSLMKLRAELIAAESDRGGDPVETAQRLRKALATMIDVETKQPPMTIASADVTDPGDDVDTEDNA
jgi:hypothetical protein